MPRDGFQRTSEDIGADALDGAESEPIPEAEIRGRRNSKAIVAIHNPAIDAMEPVSQDIGEKLTAEQIRAATDDFSKALEWALAPKASTLDHWLVELGARASVLIAAMRPELSEGLYIVPELGKSLMRAFACGAREVMRRLQWAGLRFWRLIGWLRDAKDLADLGENLQLVAYALKPELIGGATLAEIGAHTNKTRQAINRIVNRLRDKLLGQKALAMRGDITRTRCRNAQLCCP